MDITEFLDKAFRSTLIYCHPNIYNSGSQTLCTLLQVYQLAIVHALQILLRITN